MARRRPQDDPPSQIAQFCELFDFLPEVQFWIKDRGGRYEWVNVEFLLNYALERREDVVGRTDFDLSPPHLAAQYDADDQLVLAGSPVINRVELVGRFDHTARWCLTTKLPVRNERRRVTGTIGMTRPILEGSVQDWAAMPLGRVIEHISKHYREPLGNEELARLACLSVRAFERQFRTHYRQSPHQYVMRLRVRMASHALVHGDAPIAAVAAEHGFADQSYFTREFRAVIGDTPAAYRQRYRRS
jgi:AraC-like DNA-binding protein